MIRINVGKYLYRVIDFLIVFIYLLVLIFIAAGGFEYRIFKIGGIKFTFTSIFRPAVFLILLFVARAILKRQGKYNLNKKLFENPFNLLLSCCIFYAGIVIPFLLYRYYSFEYNWGKFLISSPRVISIIPVSFLVIFLMIIFLRLKFILRNDWGALLISMTVLYSPAISEIYILNFKPLYLLILLVLSIAVYKIRFVFSPKSLVVLASVSGCILIIYFANFYVSIADKFLKNSVYKDYKNKNYAYFTDCINFLQKGAKVLTSEKYAPYIGSEYKVFCKKDLKGTRLNEIDFILYNSREKFISSPIFEDLYERGDFFIAVNKSRIRIIPGLIHVFEKEDSLKGVEYKVMNSEYKYGFNEEGMVFSAFFDGDNFEDEYVSIKYKGLDVDLVRYPVFKMRYKIEDNDIQMYEILIGIDINNDKTADIYVVQHTPDASMRWDGFILPVYNLARVIYKGSKIYRLAEIEINFHKGWGVDCDMAGKRKYYRFWLKDFGFFTYETI